MTKRREMFGTLATLAGIAALPFVVEAAEGQREAKSVTSASLASSVLRLMEKAQVAGLKRESEALRACAEAILRGGK